MSAVAQGEGREEEEEGEVKVERPVTDSSDENMFLKVLHFQFVPYLNYGTFTNFLSVSFVAFPRNLILRLCL